jgi:hypothetical protein
MLSIQDLGIETAIILGGNDVRRMRLTTAHWLRRIWRIRGLV